jgi:hypothetical protein
MYILRTPYLDLHLYLDLYPYLYLYLYLYLYNQFMSIHVFNTVL